MINIFYISDTLNTDTSVKDNLESSFLSTEYKLLDLNTILSPNFHYKKKSDYYDNVSILLLEDKDLSLLERINSRIQFSYSILLVDEIDRTIQKHLAKFDLIYTKNEAWRNIERAICLFARLAKHEKKEFPLQRENKLVMESNKMFHTLFNEMSNGGVILETEDDGKSFILKDANKKSLAIEEKNREEYIGYRFEDVFPTSINSGLLDDVGKVFSTSIPKRCTIKIEEDDRIKFIHENYIYKISDTEIVILYNDVTYESRMLSALEKSETLYRSLYNNIPSGLMLIDDKFIIKDVNESTCNITGYSRSELIGQSCSMICPRDVGNDECPFWHELDSRVEEINTIVKGKNDRIIPVIKNSRKLQLGDENYLMESFLDISAMKRAEQQIEEDLDEKKILLREIHHRVKNNLNIISSLLNIQSKKINSPEQAIKAFDNSKMRIYSMALVHEVLYKSHNLKRIPFREYATLLVKYYAEVFEGKNVSFELNIQKEKLSVNKALNCGLLINELVTNSMKHAFKTQEKGIIKISLDSSGAQYILGVSDNGIGVEINYCDKESSFGMQLVGMLVSQLNGQMRSNNEAGTAIEVRFNKD